MKTFYIFLILLSALALSCSVEPETLHYGHDACHACKMTLVDKKFGAEIVTSKGKVYKFDDINCMVNFYNSGEVLEDDVAYQLVIDFTHPDKFVNAREAFYLKSKKIKSPMNGGVAAFGTKEEAEQINKKWKGIWLSWGELVTEFK